MSQPFQICKASQMNTVLDSQHHTSVLSSINTRCVVLALCVGVVLVLVAQSHSNIPTRTKKYERKQFKLQGFLELLGHHRMRACVGHRVESFKSPSRNTFTIVLVQVGNIGLLFLASEVVKLKNYASTTGDRYICMWLSCRTLER